MKDLSCYRIICKDQSQNSRQGMFYRHHIIARIMQSTTTTALVSVLTSCIERGGGGGGGADHRSILSFLLARLVGRINFESEQ
jgi:hypothetical protein